MTNLEVLFRALTDAQADIVVIGRLAAVVQGVPYVTNDADLCYDPSPQNRQKLVQALAPLHPYGFRRANSEGGWVEQPAYSMLIRWSHEDRAFLVTLPEWEGRLQNWHAATHGVTYADAAKNGQEVLEMLVEHAQERGEPLPQPRVFAMSA